MAFLPRKRPSNCFLADGSLSLSFLSEIMHLRFCRSGLLKPVRMLGSLLMLSDAIPSLSLFFAISLE